MQKRSNERDLLEAGIYDETLKHGSIKKRKHRSRANGEEIGSVRNRGDQEASEYDEINSNPGYSYMGEGSGKSNPSVYDEE